MPLGMRTEATGWPFTWQCLRLFLQPCPPSLPHLFLPLLLYAMFAAEFVFIRPLSHRLPNPAAEPIELAPLMASHRSSMHAVLKNTMASAGLDSSSFDSASASDDS
ncbi:hypothetical protein B0I35DRAFT_483342 [Stachybotrys elegans]|uniref:Uncharacterized protein n=1 Tax=Stachybotrys elegans TaxID=80388 RepID=A0A8K0SC89_9HYPO|nr:hypothetical protein B0I35DRAFT_483342 [Stachybotrys elegans]